MNYLSLNLESTEKWSSIYFKVITGHLHEDFICLILCSWIVILYTLNEVVRKYRHLVCRGISKLVMDMLVMKILCVIKLKSPPPKYIHRCHHSGKTRHGMICWNIHVHVSTQCLAWLLCLLCLFVFFTKSFLTQSFFANTCFANFMQVGLAKFTCVESHQSLSRSAVALGTCIVQVAISSYFWNSY